MITEIKTNRCNRSINHRNHFLIAVISSLIAVITSSQEGSL
jgi:hypothetical protein